MSLDKDDSDFEVCLTSSQYNRILSVEKDCKKERQQARVVRQQLQREVEALKKQLAVYESTVKSKSQQIDQLTIECLRLKKLRLAHEDQIRNYKEQQLRIKEHNLSQLQQSVRENKEMKEKRMTDQNIILDLKEELDNYKRQNVVLSEKMITRVKEFQVANQKASEKVSELEKQLVENQKRILFFEKKTTEAEVELSKSKQQILALNKQASKISKSKIDLETTVKKQIEEHQQAKRRFEDQSKRINQQKQQLLKQRDTQLSKRDDEISKINFLLTESNKKINEFLDTSHQNAHDDTRQKFSSKVYKALQWLKEGILQPSELKDQIENIMTFEKQYEDIINQDNQKIKQLELKVLDLELTNKDLSQKQISTEKQLSESSKLIKQISQMKISKEETHLISQNVVLKEEIEKLKLKLKRVTEEYDRAVESYTHTISDIQLKNEKDCALLPELQNEVQALKLFHEFYTIEAKQGIERFEKQVQQMKRETNLLNPQLIMKSLYRNHPYLKK